MKDAKTMMAELERARRKRIRATVDAINAHKDLLVVIRAMRPQPLLHRPRNKTG